MIGPQTRSHSSNRRSRKDTRLRSEQLWSPRDKAAKQLITRSVDPRLTQAVKVRLVSNESNPSKSWVTYRAVQHVVPLIAALLDMILQGTRIEWFEQLEAAEELLRDSHHGTPVVKLSAVLRPLATSSSNQSGAECLTFGAEKTVTSMRSLKNS